MYKKARRQKSCLGFRSKRTLFEKKKMPKVRRSRKPPPEGWELIEPTLDELDQKMREGKFLLHNIVGFPCLLRPWNSKLDELHTIKSFVITYCYFLLLQLKQNHMKGNERQSLCGLYLGNNVPCYGQ